MEMGTGFEKLETVFRDATDPILIEDLDGIVLDLNDEDVRTYGYSREELIGQPIKKIVPSERHEQADELLARCRDGQTVRDIDGVRCTKQMELVPVLLSLSLLKNDDGVPTAVATFAKDISTLREAEDELRQANRVFRDATDPILIEDLSGRVIDLNDQAESTYGFTREELLGQPIKMIVPAAKHGQADGLLERCKAGEVIRDIEGLRVTKQGQQIPVLLSLSLLKHENGQPCAIATFAKDLSQMKAAEEEIRQLTRVFRDAADPIILENLEGEVTDLNSAAERLYGWQRDELLGQPIKAIVPESRHVQAEDLLNRCIAGEEVRNVEGLRMTRDGNELPVLITLSLLKDETGHNLGVASFAKEITAQKAAETELRQLADKLEARVHERTAEIEKTNDLLTHELAVAKELSNAADREHEAVLLGDSISVRSLRDNIDAYAETNEPLLLVGPAGAGQEAVARALHRASPRAGRPFIYVDVATAGAAEDTLFETRTDETGESIPGKAALANGGTLYLQGVDRLSQEGQTSLLNFLKHAESARQAGQTPVPDVRLVAFTAHDLMSGTQQLNFDAELERSIGRRKLAIPSLAERRDDILPIAERITLLRARSMGKVLDGLTEEAGQSLLNYSWPGNVEELQSVLERAVVLSKGTQLEIPVELLREGRKLGSYTLDKQLGTGAMGEVWLAKHALLARPAAVKLIRKQALEVEAKQQETLRSRFQREAKATASLRSPNTVELYDFGVSEDGNFYYVMEYLTGIDLQNAVEDFGVWKTGRVIDVLSQTCLSLAEAHEAGLVHRDIKPSNIFTCRLGKACDVAKVLDFGVVRLTDSQDHLVTATGQLSGTPACMAPELIEGTKADAAADIYGLGCVAFWLLTGKTVFDAPNLMALLMQHATKTPDAPSTYDASIPPEMDALVLQCLAKKPEDRPRDAMELREKLAAIPLHEPWSETLAFAWWDENLPVIQTGKNNQPTNANEATIDVPYPG